MKFCDKLILIGVLIIIIAVLHYGLPVVNKLFDGKEGMTASSRGGVLSEKERSSIIKPVENVTNNGNVDESDNGLPTNSDKTDVGGGNSYHVHYHISPTTQDNTDDNTNTNSSTNSFADNVSANPLGYFNTPTNVSDVGSQVSSAFNNSLTSTDPANPQIQPNDTPAPLSESNFATINSATEMPKTSEYTKEYPCRESITGMFTDCGPRAGNIECYSELYGSCANGANSS